jgi:retron-type reverse transcriptase
MRSPQNVLKSLTSKATNANYHYQRLYRNLYNPEFYLLAYQRIQAKQGNMTAGTDGKTIDGMGMKRIESIIAKIKNFSFQPNPARRTYIQKANGKQRPLGIPSFDDKLVQEVGAYDTGKYFMSDFLQYFARFSTKTELSYGFTVCENQFYRREMVR